MYNKLLPFVRLTYSAAVSTEFSPTKKTETDAASQNLNELENNITVDNSTSKISKVYNVVESVDTERDINSIAEKGNQENEMRQEKAGRGSPRKSKIMTRSNAIEVEKTRTIGQDRKYAIRGERNSTKVSDDDLSKTGGNTRQISKGVGETENEMGLRRSSRNRNKGKSPKVMNGKKMLKANTKNKQITKTRIEKFKQNSGNKCVDENNSSINRQNSIEGATKSKGDLYDFKNDNESTSKKSKPKSKRSLQNVFEASVGTRRQNDSGENIFLEKKDNRNQVNSRTIAESGNNDSSQSKDSYNSGNEGDVNNSAKNAEANQRGHV